MTDIKTMTDFKSWLAKKNSFPIKVCTDIASRLNRAKGIVDIEKYKDVDEALFHLSTKAAFKSLTVSVRSQVRRSVKLYMEFMKRGDSKR